MGKLINLHGLDDKDVDNHIKIIALAAKCIGWGMGFLGKENEPVRGFFIGDQEFADTVYGKLEAFTSEEQIIKRILKRSNIPDSQFDGKLIRLGELDAMDVDDHVSIIALVVKSVDWEIGSPEKEDVPFTGFIVGEKDFVEITLKKLNIVSHLFREEK